MAIPQIRTPESLAAGVYANGVVTWSTPSEFTVDFIVSLPAEQGRSPAGDDVILAPQLVVARVKIPPPLVYQLMRNLAKTLDEHEKRIGPVPDFLGGAEFGSKESDDEN